MGQVPSSQTLAWLQFPADDSGSSKLAVCDWSGDQYYSSIRSARVLVRGERGEISNSTARYLLDPATPAVEFELRRVDVGPTENWGNSLQGSFHRGYLGGGEWLFLNPFAPARGHASLAARLTDDELANVRTDAGGDNGIDHNQDPLRFPYFCDPIISTRIRMCARDIP